jgi:hypothetical protein
LRRSELVALAIENAEIIPERGVQLLIRKSKTDQQGKGQYVAIWENPINAEFCPVIGLQKWLEFRKLGKDLNDDAGAGEGALLPLSCAVTKGGIITGLQLSDKAVVRLIKEVSTNAGLEPNLYSGHSLRAGLMTAAGDAGAELANAMRPSRHAQLKRRWVTSGPPISGDLSPNFPLLISRVRGCRHAHRDGVS